jgi:hypothetical protein
VRSTRRLKARSVVSMAVTVVCAAPVARAATLTLYYDNISDSDGQSYGYGVTGGNYANVPTTINIAVGDTFEFGIDAVLTNNINPDAGEKTGTPGHTFVQPSYLGLSTLSIAVPSSDSHADYLVPVTNGSPIGTFHGQADYNCTASLNNQSGLGDSSPINNDSNPAVPIWSNNTEGDVSPAFNGDVGDTFSIFQGNGAITSNTAAGALTISQYGAAVASYATATDFFSGLSYQAERPGTVTLSPQDVALGTSYWSNTSAGSSSVASGYQAMRFFNQGDVIGKLPKLVINITGVGPPLPGSHPLISLTAAADGAPTNYGVPLGSVDASGNGSNQLSQNYIDIITPTGFVEAQGFKSASTEEIYAVAVFVNNGQATTAQIDKLVSAINNGDSAVPASSGVLAVDNYSELATGTPYPFTTIYNQYNMFLEFPSPEATTTS